MIQPPALNKERLAKSLSTAQIATIRRRLTKRSINENTQENPPKPLCFQAKNPLAHRVL